jgi:hypothetical protein
LIISLNTIQRSTFWNWIIPTTAFEHVDTRNLFKLLKSTYIYMLSPKVIISVEKLSHVNNWEWLWLGLQSGVSSGLSAIKPKRKKSCFQTSFLVRFYYIDIRLGYIYSHLDEYACHENVCRPTETDVFLNNDFFF